MPKLTKRRVEAAEPQNKETFIWDEDVPGFGLLILTGCRLNEIMKLKWQHVDLPGRALRLPDSKSGAKVVHLSQPAADLLATAPRIDSNPWVITGTLDGKAPSDLQPFWQRVRARAGLKDVRIHDLRHTFASTAVAGSLSGALG